MNFIEIIGAVAGVLAVVGVLLNNRRRISCFYVWMISNAISCGLHVYAAMAVGADTWTLAARDIVFLVLAFDGVMRWGKKYEV